MSPKHPKHNQEARPRIKASNHVEGAHYFAILGRYFPGMKETVITWRIPTAVLCNDSKFQMFRPVEEGTFISGDGYLVSARCLDQAPKYD